MSDLSQSNLKIVKNYTTGFNTKVFVEDIGGCVPLDDYLDELAKRTSETTGGGQEGNELSEMGFSSSADANNNTTVLQSLIDDMPNREKKVIKIPYGLFNVNDITLNSNDIVIEGAGKPNINTMKNGLTGGTILKGGTVLLNNKYNPTLKKLGVDVSDVSARDAINSGLSVAGIQRINIQDVITLGSGSNHGLLCTSGGNNLIDNFDAYSFDHAFVLRCSNSTVNGFYAHDCAASSGMIESVVDNGELNANYNIITNGIVDGKNRGFNGVVIKAGSAGTESKYNIITNITTILAVYGVRVTGVGSATHNTLNTMNLIGCEQNAVYVTEGANKNSFGGLRAFDTGADSFVNDSGGIQNDLVGCHSEGHAGLAILGLWRTQNVII